MMKIKQFLKITVLLIILFNLPFRGIAQTNKTLDKILAIIGKNRIVLQSDVEMQAQQMKLQDKNLIVNDSVKALLLHQMMVRKLLVEQAERDSLLVSEEELEGNLDNRIRSFERMAGSKEKLEEQSGKTEYQMKEDSRDFFREEMMAEKVQTKILSGLKVTPEEVTNFFKKIPSDSLPNFPATIEVGQIVRDPSTSTEMDKYAKDKIQDIRNQIVNDHKNFETLAGIYSDDPGSRDNGGRYNGITRNGDWAPEFVSASFRLQNGEISPVFKTKFGYHIVQMIQRKGDQVDVRHILIIPKHTSGDINLALEKLDSVRANLITAKINFSEAVGKYSTDDQSKLTGGMITDQRNGSSQLEIDQLDPAMVLMLDSIKVGSYSTPQQFKNQQGEISCRIVYLKNRTEPHKANLRDDYSKIQAVAKQQKETNKVNAWIREKLPSYYIKVDEQYLNNPALALWKNQMDKTAKK